MNIAIVGATGKELVLTNLGESDYAKYHVIIASDSDTEKSKVAEISPPLPPAIIAGPNSVNADIGDSVTFSVKAESLIPIDYQWYKNGVAITDGTNEVLTIQNVEKKDYISNIHCRNREKWFKPASFDPYKSLQYLYSTPPSPSQLFWSFGLWRVTHRSSQSEYSKTSS